MNLRIREANLNDYDNVCALTLEVHKLHLKNRPDVYRDVDTPFKKDYYCELLTDKDAKIFVVENSESNELVAYSIIKILPTANVPVILPQKFAYIDDFCVKSDHNKKGIGRMLFDYLVSYAKDKKVSSLQLNVWEFNDNAIKFYEAMGMNTRNRRMELNI
ncbi:GNAT family N-acetyltransferase [Clostridium oryzae]|uniref:Ribosomal-protein-alanine N-acetyltransferase n=1 Tax=Clostridium oryzae TaxID=1450648 RepID=A0A1V4IU08_9CLOT|nr:GNAT family N-acetyltransferase [Clostridium oryzae]OPJ62937.1 ribosomal-protein-alanine N-acetyltransferase [Clostridium oryzae]